MTYVMILAVLFYVTVFYMHRNNSYKWDRKYERGGIAFFESGKGLF